MSEDTKWDEEERDSPVVVRVADRWEGEDDDGDVKDNWDDEDEEPVSEKKPVTAAPTAVSKSKKKKLAEAIAAKEAAESARRVPVTADEILADKLAKQRLQEESDLRLAIESFGLSDSVSREQLDEVRKSLVDKLKLVEKSIHYVSFLEATFRDLCAALDADDIKRLGSNLTALSNEKQKATKNVKKKKKGAAIRVERSELDYEDDGHEYDDFM